MKASQHQGAEQFSASRRSTPAAAGPTPPDGTPPAINRRVAIVAGSVSLVTLFGGALVIRSLPSPPPKPLASPPLPGATPVRSLPDNAHALTPMSPQEYAAFQPILEPNLASTNQDDSSPCKDLLVRLALMPGPEARGEFRVISGAYTSPTFQLSLGPMAIPIPYPAPYATGKGVLGIEGTAENGVLGLTPGLPLNMTNTTVVQIPVWWPVNPNCR